MTDSTPAETSEQKARVDKLQRMALGKNTSLTVYLTSDAAREVTGQVLVACHHELFLMSQSRPPHSIHSERSWTPESIVEHDMPVLCGSFMDLARSPGVFSWDPIRIEEATRGRVQDPFHRDLQRRTSDHTGRHTVGRPCRDDYDGG